MIRALVRTPLVWILCAAAALRITGLFWGLPAADGWDNDGFAPRNFLTALALTYTPGSYFTYPPLHAFVLAILTLPGIVSALLQTPSFGQADVIGEITKPAYMTFFAVVARLVTAAMSLGIIWCIGEMTRRIAGARAGLFAAGACALGVVFTYYSQVSNLDVPYLFWASLSLLLCMRAVTERRSRLFWWAALLALLLVDGAITNPIGFARRVAFLTGPASQDYAQYLQSPAGWMALLEDMARFFLRGHGVVAVLLAAFGLGLHLSRFRDDKAIWVAGLLPGLAIISFILCFNFSALRTDHRFLLPQALFAAVYIGIAADFLAFHTARSLAFGARFLLAAIALFSLHQAIAVNAAMLFDPRYDVERWMAAHVRPGDTIEIYGQNIFQPRFPATARVIRVGQGDLKVRNPLPRVTELKEAFAAPRDAKFIIVSGNWVRRYLREARPTRTGRIYDKTQRDAFRDGDARRYFSALDEGRLPYRLVHVAHFQGKFWPAVRIHDSLAEPIGIYERLP